MGMSVVTLPRVADRDRDGDRDQMLAELREVEHWRRLVVARIDLAVAAVTALEPPADRSLPAAPALPEGLRSLIGIPPDEAGCRREAACLEPLRAVLDDLDCYALALRALSSDPIR